MMRKCNRFDFGLRLPSAAPGLVFLLSAGLATAPATAADAAHGEQLAKRWCASCHVVAPDQARGADDVPAFPTIANMQGFDAGKLAAFLMDPHPKMPDMQLGRGEANDLAAYIGSLRK